MSRTLPQGLRDALSFPLFESLFGRRSRRFALGTEIPNGPLAYKSRHSPLPLTELERTVLLTATGGNTGWNYLIAHNPAYAPHLPNYGSAAGGRTFPSAGAIHTSDLFFTDDDGVYFLPLRDAPALVDAHVDSSDLDALLQAHQSRIRKLTNGRLHIPAIEPYMVGHNRWCANRPGSLLLIPVGDLAQHMIAMLCFQVQCGYCIYDDVHNEQIPGLRAFSLIDIERALPLTWLEQYALTSLAAELTTACHNGMLVLQAMGLGGWMFGGIDRHALLGMSDDPNVPGLGFRYDRKPGPLPNATGLPGVFEGYCPPFYPNMRAAVETFTQRKFGPGGPFNSATEGPWKDTPKVRSSAEVHSEEFKDCVATMAQYIYDRFGKFPGTVPSIYCGMYLQAHHLDLEFYDHHFKPGAYLTTHAEHMSSWHSEQ